MSKIRLDQALVQQGYAPTRQKAQAIIMSGQVFVAGKRIDKCGFAIPAEAEIEVRGNTLRYVSRGGLKLEKAMQTWPITLEAAVCMDCGASTGGFTDCMLQNGASKVYSVDVGYGQLDWKLRTDPRVINMERTNARYLTVEQIAEAPAIRFQWNDRDDKTVFVGSIAQYWQKVLPEVVQSQADDTLSLDYQVAALISSITVARKVMNHESRLQRLEKMFAINEND